MSSHSIPHCTHSIHVSRSATRLNEINSDRLYFTLRVKRRRFRLAWDCTRPDRLRVVGSTVDIADVLSAAGRAYVLAQIYRLVEFPTHLQPTLPATATAWEVAR